MGLKENKQRSITMNILYFGDNLEILKTYINDESIDLIYLDPPFQSGRNYNIIFRPEEGATINGADAQIRTFNDTWKWGEEAEKNYEGLISCTLTKIRPSPKLIELMKSLRNYLGNCSMMAYLSMMAPRLLELKRVLKRTGSIYLHCDPTASHYLKLLMDAIFGTNNFRNEIIWHYRTGGVSKRYFARKHDIIFFYTKSNEYKFNPIQVKEYYKDIYGEDFKPSFEDRNGGVDENGYYRYAYKDDVWDIRAVFNMSKEYVGYPTQKPEALLEQIIQASSEEGDWVLDPFCGCGTTIAVAQKLQRKWIGIDITYLAIDVISKRLRKSGITEGKDFIIMGQPTDLYSARKLASEDPFQFQIWCISKFPNAIPKETMTGDKGVDGVIYFMKPLSNKQSKRKSQSYDIGKIIIQVKGSKKANPAMVRELAGTVDSQEADMGILVILDKPTQNMISEAVSHGYFEYFGRKIPKIQIISVSDLFDTNKIFTTLSIPQQGIKPYQLQAIPKPQKKLF